MYIIRTTCISAQKTFADLDLSVLNADANGILRTVEPAYENIPLNVLRRMGKAVRLSIGASLPLVKGFKNVNGIIIGTANGGMEDCIKFLNQVIEYNEGTLTPTNFVQSTPNAIAAQIGLNTRNNQYNITHVHRGLAFENAVIDAMMYLKENPTSTLLLGGVDEVSDYNYNIERLGGWYRQQPISNADLYATSAEGSLAGEGVAMFIVSDTSKDAIAKVEAIKTFSTHDEKEVALQLRVFLEEHKLQNKIGVFLSGENGDNRMQPYYTLCENMLEKDIPVAHFKHYIGEFPTSSALAVFLGVQFVQPSSIPSHFIKRGSIDEEIKSVLIYNTYKGHQHSFIVVSKL